MAATCLVVLVALVALAGCGHQDQGGNADPTQVDAVSPPQLGACRVLSRSDVDQDSNATRTVACSAPHTAQTYAVGSLPDDLTDTSYDSRELGLFAYQTCTAKLQHFLGADQSTAMRTILTWAWFRPSQTAWGKGARWYRCDVVGGAGSPDGSGVAGHLVDLPTTARGLLEGRPDDTWMACVAGASVDTSPRIPCSQPHRWRAVTTIKVGEPSDSYPGDQLVETRTRDYCQASVQAWLDYPADYGFGYTWFHQAEWDAGNRRSVCWARTSA